jgi:15-cis-phytoene synthase
VSGPAPDALRAGLGEAAADLGRRGLPVPSLDGKLLRPLAAYLALPDSLRRSSGRHGAAFWSGALALEMVHEASLLHDDIVDAADLRRGVPTLAARYGPGRALVRGDHLLTASYRVAAEAGLPSFMAAFVRAVERTVAGEIRQGETAGTAISLDTYREVVEGKSGELFGVALALAAALRGEDTEPATASGRRLGALYQMVDDFLDYCPGTVHGKPAFQDLRQRKWTFVLSGFEGGLPAAATALEDEGDAFTTRLTIPAAGGSILRRALATLEAEADEVVETMPAPALAELVESWLRAARTALAHNEAHVLAQAEAHAVRAPELAWSPSRAAAAAPSPEAVVAARAGALGGPDRWRGYFAHHAHTFRFAARLFPPEARRQVEGVYAFCRFTDDLVDETRVPAPAARARLEAWGGLAAAAYEGHETGIPLADQVMGTMQREGVPFDYVAELLAGMATDLDPVRFETLAELDTYTYRVASVVGGWLTELFGVRDPETLARAYGLGHAMQLTNIVRDVGEDWRRGRLYLPRDLRERAGVDLSVVERVATAGRPVPVCWRTLMETVMTRADHHYERAFEALPALPPFFARPVAVSARAYQGIHDAVRRNGYDNGSLRAHTSLIAKARLGVQGLVDLRRSRWRPPGTPARWSMIPHDGRSA